MLNKWYGDENRQERQYAREKYRTEIVTQSNLNYGTGVEDLEL